MAVRWPWPFRRPCDRKRLRLHSVGGGVGDELMCTAILREIKRRNPACEITFVCRHPPLFKGFDAVDRLEAFYPGETDPGHGLGYSHLTPPPRALAVMMAECVGLRLPESIRLEPPGLEDVSEEFRALAERTSKPRVVIQPVAGHWTPNKQWPATRWAELVRSLAIDFQVIEVGAKQTLFPDLNLEGFRSFAGVTDLSQFIWLVSSADVFVGPPSGGMHVAHAFRVRSVIVHGGYEAPEGYDYDTVTPLYNPVECAPCWLTSECPVSLQCMNGISIETVRKAVDEVARGLDTGRGA